MKRHQDRLRISVLVLGCAALPGLAWAQADTSGNAAPGARSEAEQIEEVLVTAQRREESLQKASLSVVAIGNEELAARGVSNLAGFADLVPGVRIGYAAANMQIYVRGVGESTSTWHQQGAVAVSMDGVYQSRTTVLAPLMLDVERVEVLRGPQGTLYGRNATAGAFNVISRAPSLSGNEQYLAADLGNYSLRRFEGAINHVLSDDFAVRGAVAIVRRDGYLSDGGNAEEFVSARLRALWQPSDIVTVNFIGEYADIGGYGQARTFRPVQFGDPWIGPQDSRVNTTNFPLLKARSNPGQDTKYQALSANVDVDLGGSVLTIIPAYKATDTTESNAPDFQFSTISRSDQYSLEARLSRSTDSLKWIVGAYGLKEKMFGDEFTNQRTILTGVGLLGTYYIPNLTSKTWAAFGEGTLSLTDTFRVVGGVRYSWDGKDRDMTASETQYTGLTTTAFTVGGRYLTSAHWDAMTWRAGIEYDVGPQNMLYATVSKGFKGGGFSATGPDAFDPEFLVAYSLGSKNRFFDNSLQLNLEAFNWDYTNQQVSFLGVNNAGVTTFITRNAGSAQIYGLDVDLQWRPSSRDLLSIGAEYLHAKYDEFVYSAIGGGAIGTVLATGCISGGPGLAAGQILNDCSGKTLPQAPEVSGNARYIHTFGLRNGATVDFGATMRFASLAYLGLNYSSEYHRQEAYETFDADLTYRPASEKWSLQFWVRNITDEVVYQQASNSSSISPNSGPNRSSVAAIAPPRTFGVHLNVEF